MERHSLQKIIVVFLVLFGSGLTSGVSSSITQTNNRPQTIQHRDVTWDVTLNVTETGGGFDTVVFGEAPDARDGPPADAYDVAKPPPNPPPYIRAYLNDNLGTPYNLLWKDYRHYPATTKTWNLTIKYVTGKYGTRTTATISWNAAEINTSEYTNITLCTDSGTPLRNMLLVHTYSFNCPDDTLQKFKIICLLNHAPNTPSAPSPSDGATNVSITTDLSWTGGDPDGGDTVLYDVYFGTAATPPIVFHNQSATTYDLGTLSYNTPYYWRIVAWDNHGARTAGPTWSFTTTPPPNQPPYTPSSPSPANGATNVSITADLSWTGGDPDSGDTVLYDVYFGTPTNPPIVFHNQSATTYDPGTLSYSTTYYWYIVSWDNHGARTAGPTWSFTTHLNSPPNTPSNPSPANGATDVSITTDLSWTGGDPNSGDTVLYDVYFGTPSSPPIVMHNQSGTTYDLGTLLYSTTYYWRIVAWDNHGARTAGPIWSFTTHLESPPNTPSNPSPANGATDVSITTDLSWTGGDPDSGDTVTYDVYFGTASSPPIVIHNQTGTTYDPGPLAYNTHYYWKIVAWDNHGFSTPGPTWSFTTEPHPNQPPYAPSNPNPANGSTNILNNVTLQWTGGDPDSGDIVTYDVYFGASLPLAKVSANQTTTSYSVTSLQYGQKYYWKIVAWDHQGLSTTGPQWEFTVRVDSFAPTVRISQPLNGFLYINFLGLRTFKIPFLTTMVIGKIDVTADATDNQSGVSRVEFYIDDVLQSTDTAAPYEWKWTKRGLLFPYVLKVIAYDNAGNQKSDQLDVWKVL